MNAFVTFSAGSKRQFFMFLCFILVCGINDINVHTHRKELAMQQVMASTGYVKIGNDYINPQSITHIGKNQDGTTYVSYNTLAQGPQGIGPTSDSIPIDSDKFAKSAIKAMQTGEIIDVMA